MNQETAGFGKPEPAEEKPADRAAGAPEKQEVLSDSVKQAFKQGRLNDPMILLRRLLNEREGDRFTPMVPEGAARELTSMLADYDGLAARVTAKLEDFEAFALRLRRWSQNMEASSAPRGVVRDDADNVRRTHRAFADFATACAGIARRLRGVQIPPGAQKDEALIVGAITALSQSSMALEEKTQKIGRYGRWLEDYLRR